LETVPRHATLWHKTVLNTSNTTELVRQDMLLRTMPNQQVLARKVIEAYRIIHGELLGLTARMKELRDRAEMAAGSIEPQRELILSA
jgi:hypothetical protein